MKAIGGYFGLELYKGNEFHSDAIRLNTGRNAFEYILLANSYTKVYLPYFSCDVLLEPLKKHHLPFEFYPIDERFEPIYDYNGLKGNEVFLYINYFGLKDHFITKLSKLLNNIIIDNSQSFFSKPVLGIDTFYSARKFFGVPDGAYLYSNKTFDRTLEKDESANRCSHLLKRIDEDAESGYSDFLINEKKIENQDIKAMSVLTASLLSSIDYHKIALKRNRNFKYLHKKLKTRNKLSIDELNINAPMVYPYWTDQIGLRQHLLNNKVYTAIYWPNVKEWSDVGSLEYRLVDDIVYLPIDQRNNYDDLNRIIKLVIDA